MASKKCGICGETASGTYKISDMLFVSEPNTYICSSCFNHYSLGNDNYLLEKLNERKLKEKRLAE